MQLWSRPDICGRSSGLRWLHGSYATVWTILPTRFDRHLKAIRNELQPGQDVLRHTFFSMHVAAFKRVGNTEAVQKKHCLNLEPYTEGGEFWGILPVVPANHIIPITGSITGSAPKKEDRCSTVTAVSLLYCSFQTHTFETGV